MTRRASSVLLTLWLLAGCSSTPHALPPDVIQTHLAAPLEKVKTAVTQVLTDGGYDVDWKDDGTLETGYRAEMHGPWNWLYRWRFGTIKSRVEASVKAADEQTTTLKLEVRSEGKDGIFTGWDDVQNAAPQSAENQLRLIKNALQLL
ncbi:MAG: hypothetical protein U0412_10695 [Nitrospira sp.]